MWIRHFIKNNTWITDIIEKKIERKSGSGSKLGIYKTNYVGFKKRII